ncbi:MAG: hypothetical protein ABJA10_10730 [Aestuariivirga sp.]
MDGEKSNELPQREMDGAAIEVFKGIMEKIEVANGGDTDKCWLWPSVKNWPSDWEPLPKGYSASIDGRGYGQFVLSAIPGVKRQVSPNAHQLSYEHYNLLLDPTLKHPAFNGGDWLGKNYLKTTQTVKTAEGDMKDMRRVVRHDPQRCASKSCVNPFHFIIGTDWQNGQLDEFLTEDVVELSEAAFSHFNEVVKDIEKGELDARVLANKYKLKGIEILNIAKVAGLPWRSLLHDFNPTGKVDHKPKP